MLNFILCLIVSVLLLSAPTPTIFLPIQQLMIDIWESISTKWGVK